jgi:hypothetical protein
MMNPRTIKSTITTPTTIPAIVPPEILDDAIGDTGGVFAGEDDFGGAVGGGELEAYVISECIF